MSLNAKQADFTRHVGKLLTWCARYEIDVILAEAYRTPEQAAIYAKQGRGIKNSTHTKKLAVDLFILKDGVPSWDPEDYRPLGRYWKACHDLARWGGDFKNRDAVHFSFEHGGVK